MSTTNIDSASCSNKQIQPKSAPFVSHNLTSLVYSWNPKSLDFTSHYLGRVTDRPAGEAAPNFKLDTKPCKANIPKKPNTCYGPTPTALPYIQHILNPLVPTNGNIALPYAQHRLGALPAYKQTNAVPNYPPTTTPSVANQPKQHGTCFCGPNFSNSTYAAHDLQQLKPIISLKSIPAISHYLGKYPAYPKTEAPPNYRPYTGGCKWGVMNCDSVEPSGNPYVQHILNPPCVQTLQTASAPFVSHSMQSLPSKYDPGGENNTIGSSSFSTKKCVDISRPVSSCIVKLPDNTPYTQHVLELPSVIMPTLGSTYGSHMSQEYVRYDISGGSGPALRGVGTMFDSRYELPSKEYCDTPISLPYGDHILTRKLRCKNNEAISSVYGSHGTYPYVPEEQVLIDIYCNPSVDSLPYIQHWWVKEPITPPTLIKNTKNTETVIEKHLNITTGEITSFTPPETCPKAELDFGVILNDSVKIGQKQCSPFAGVFNKVGSGYPTYEVISGDPLGVHFVFQVSGLQKASTKYFGCNTKQIPAAQHTLYKTTPFSVVSNNPHQINYL